MVTLTVPRIAVPTRFYSRDNIEVNVRHTFATTLGFIRDHCRNGAFERGTGRAFIFHAGSQVVVQMPGGYRAIVFFFNTKDSYDALRKALKAKNNAGLFADFRGLPLN